MAMPFFIELLGLCLKALKLFLKEQESGESIRSWDQRVS